MNKFHAKKTVFEGITFDSGLECRRYQQLRLLEKGGIIRQLERQLPFVLTVNGTKIGKMIIDHGWFENNARVLEETKAPPTRTSTYRLKKRILLALNPGIDFREYP